jgi:hypothetical protein
MSKTKFHLNKNIEACNLNWKSLYLIQKHWMEFKFEYILKKKKKKMQIGAKGIKNLFISMVLNFF